MEHALELHNVVKHYDDFTLDQVTLTLPRGCVMGFIGENGAGKTTVIKAILNLIAIDSGEIRLFGENAQHLPRSLKEKIGYVPDECCFPAPLTVESLGNAMARFYTSWEQGAFQHYLRTFHIDPKKKIKELSRGTGMKLSIAAALSHHAEILILDEATGGLDPVVRDEILDIFRDFVMDENHTVFMSSHIVSDLERICDYIALIHKGKLEFCQEKDALLESYALVRCDEERLSDLPPQAVKGIRRHQFGVEALVLRDQVNPAFPMERISIEDIMVFHYKEEKKCWD